MRNKVLLTIVATLTGVSAALAQTPDTTGIYKDRQDSLQATVFTGRQDGNFLSRGKELRTEVISSAGLKKMACCNLAESFENSASVTVGYSDAVTGARQIRLLGLSGVYTQMLDENRPAMRGLAAPFGLSYVPGQWLESIQVSKGLSSVVNGVEAITGQINTEYRKPTDEKPLFLNASVMNDSKTDFNIASSLQMGDKWSTVLLGHVSGNFKTFDHNHDGFRDDPEMVQVNVANRWLYYSQSGVQVRFGFRALQDQRQGGQDGYDHKAYTLTPTSSWGSDITNRQLNAYVKVGVPISEDNAKNIAFVADYTLSDMDSWFGATKYLAGQNSGFVNVLFQDEINDSHKFTLSLGGTADRYSEDFYRKVAAQKHITVRDLMNMTSGLPYPGDWNESVKQSGEVFWKMEQRLYSDDPVSTAEFAKMMSEVDLCFEPGSEFMYGTSADILGALIERVSGMTFREFLMKSFFEPLEMNDTDFYVPEEKSDRLAKVYDYSDSGLCEVKTDHLGLRYYRDVPPAFESGGAGLCSTLDDYAKFASMLLGGGEDKGRRIMPYQAVKYMTSSCTAEAQSAQLRECWTWMGGYSYGNLMRICTDESQTSVFSSKGEYGWDGWLGTFFSNEPEHGITMLLGAQQVGIGRVGTLTREIKNIVMSELI